METLTTLKACLTIQTSLTNKPRVEPFTLIHPSSLKHNKKKQLPLNNYPSQKLSKTFSSILSTETPTTQFPTITDEPEDDPSSDDHKFEWFKQWYPVAPICDLDKRAPHAKMVMGMDVVVWWDREEEKWQVFEDKCPHRLAPLSEGRIDRNGRLQCVYHGWCFDGSGSCKYIPQAPRDGPPVHTNKKACASVYPSIEQHGIIWFWPSSDPEYKDIGTKQKPPVIPALEDPSYSYLLGQRDFPFGYEVLIENLMDPAHVPYAHYGLLRVQTTSKEISGDREGGRPMDITVKALDTTGFLAKQENGYSRFIAPCVFYAAPMSALENELSSMGSSDSDSKKKSVVLIFICVPVAPGKSRLIFSFPRNFFTWVDKVVPRWVFHITQNLVLDSDLYLIHLEEKKIEAVGVSNWLKSCFIPTKSDALVAGFRRWLKKYSNGQVDWGNHKAELPATLPKDQLMDRYWSHVVNCSSCRAALAVFKILEPCLQIFSVALIGAVAIAKQNSLSTGLQMMFVAGAILSFTASKWLGHFIYKNFYFHDYNHAFV